MPDAPDLTRTRLVDVDELYLDAENPRLAEYGPWDDPYSDDTQREILKKLWDAMAVDEVAESIAANGYFRWEPLLVVSEGGRLVVVDGNRRLAAVKLLRMPPDDREALEASRCAVAPSESLAELARLPVVDAGRDHLWPFLGFRHVNGIQPWPTLAKAQYIHDVASKLGVPLDEIARRIGDKNETVSRHYLGYSVLRQAERTGTYRRTWHNTRKFSFSLLYSALGRTAVRDYLALRADDVDEPVPADRLPELKRLMTLLFGDTNEGVRPAVGSQHPDLGRLATILAHPGARAVLEDELEQVRPDLPRAFSRAHERTQSERSLFAGALERARTALETARGKASIGYDGSASELTTAREVVRLASDLVDEMRRIAEAAGEGSSDGPDA